MHLGSFEEGSYTASVSYAARFETNMASRYKTVTAL